ncbi:MAG: hypothetical protein QNK92_11995 [Amylibacter sp.]
MHKVVLATILSIALTSSPAATLAQQDVSSENNQLERDNLLLQHQLLKNSKILNTMLDIFTTCSSTQFCPHIEDGGTCQKTTMQLKQA